MKNKALICAIIIAIGVIGVVGFIILGTAGGKTNTPAEPASTAGGEVNVQTPPVTDEPTVPPVTDEPVNPTTPPETEPVFDPGDPVGNGDIAPDEIPDEGNKVKVVDGTVETDQKQPSEPDSVVNKDQVTSGQKKADEEKPDGVENEIINDSELEKKEEAEKKKNNEAEKDDKPATVVSEEKQTGSEEDKPISFIDDTEEKSEDASSNGNAPAFVDPAQGGENPFEGGGDFEIDDHDSDEFIDDGGDRPGEGIHF